MQLLKTKPTNRKKKKTAGNGPKSPKCEGREWKPLFRRSAGIYAPDGDKSRNRRLHQVTFTTTVTRNHGLSARGEMPTDATLKRGGGANVQQMR